MELPVGVNRRYASYAICILTTLWIWVALDRPYSFYYTAWSIYANAPQSPSRDLFDYPPLFSPAMRKLCGGTPWDESVVFMCSAPAGNVAEVRNEILSCVRYAMAAGGSLVIPRIAARALPRGVGAGNSTDLKHFFDTDHFVDSLRLSCPQMRLYKTAFSVQDGERARGPFTLQPETLLKPISGAGSQIPGQWKALFDQWLAESLESDTGGPNVLLGAYLSTATDLDALPASDRLNARYDTQSRLYLDHAIRANLSVIYAASEHRADIPRLFKDAAALGIKVTSKLDLLRGRDRQSLLALTPDQQSLVDLLVLGLVSKFVGVGHSSFAWSVALRRQQFLEKDARWREGPELLGDPFSQIFGTPGSHPEFAASMWP
ncbi:alternative oxidase [Diplocarpon rosae]|nr:alternative oxidase [Diplocarpon rosae]